MSRRVGRAAARRQEVGDPIERRLLDARRDREVVLEHEDVEVLGRRPVGEARGRLLEHRDVRRVAAAHAIVVVGAKLAHLGTRGEADCLELLP